MSYAENHSVYVPLWIIPEYHLGGNANFTESDTNISSFASPDIQSVSTTWPLSVSSSGIFRMAVLPVSK